MTSPDPLRAVVVGAGHRGVLYATYAHAEPNELIITAVVEPDPVRRDRLGDEHGLPADRRLASLDDLPPAGVIADVAIDATMDADHVPTAERLLQAGYAVLLEKPIAGNADEVLSLAETSRRTGRLLMICHVLRYSPFYVAAKERVLAGDLGEIMSIQMAEYVSFDHMAAAYVRGRWSNSARSGSGILLSKCCHDIDLMAWLCDDRPARVASAGSRRLFTAERAPAGAGTRCVDDCAIESRCAYSARRQYLELGLWGTYAWEGIEELGPDPTPEQKLASLAADNPYGRCVWRSDNDVLDRQTVSVEFADGIVGSFLLSGNAAVGNRTLEIVGTRGELSGSLDTGKIRIRRIADAGDQLYQEELITTDVAGLAHGGGDLKLVADFVRAVRGEPVSVSSTKIENSIDGHLIVFAADRALAERRWVELSEFTPETQPVG
ncbi:Gfo/Idh/MocA family protein [Microlunatus sp. GCM10028923]|uniref:Gfo/Idh/MocA family protein n=1 Tax=Microlunatus sp. GCM10028923 TaxID=3273400 RepID=UPI0036169D2D